jgi:hypothetical protein
MVAFNMDTSARHGCNDCQRLGKKGITKAFTPNFQVEAMEANALTPLFTFTLEVEEYNDAEDNEAYPTDSIVIVIENYLQPSVIPLGVAIIGGCTSTSSNAKMFELKQQIKLKQKIRTF